MIVYVFKTSVDTKKKIKVLAPHLDGVEQITKWNFDLKDCDKILRVEARNIESNKICALLHALDHHCVELT